MAKNRPKTITIKDDTKRLFKAFKKADKGFVSIGIHEDKTYDDGTQVALVAAVHEFGSKAKGIPQRSFIRSTIDTQKKQIDKDRLRAFSLFMSKRLTLNRALEQWGKSIAIRIQNKIKKGPFEPNADATLQKKRGTKPLIDTTTLLNSVVAKVKL